MVVYIILDKDLIETTFDNYSIPEKVLIFITEILPVLVIYYGVLLSSSSSNRNNIREIAQTLSQTNSEELPTSPTHHSIQDFIESETEARLVLHLSEEITLSPKLNGINKSIKFPAEEESGAETTSGVPLQTSTDFIGPMSPLLSPSSR
jgi:hypothetical protein